MRSKEHQKFLIEQYNRNRPADEFVHNMSDLNRVLLDKEVNDLSKRTVIITERRVYHKVGKLTIELPKDIPLNDVEEWLDSNTEKWEQELDKEFKTNAKLHYGLGLDNPDCDGMNEAMADRETRYDVNGKNLGGHI